MYTRERVNRIITEWTDLMTAVERACVEYGSHRVDDSSHPDEVYTDEGVVGLWWQFPAERRVECPMAFFLADEIGRRSLLEAEGRTYRTRAEICASR